jgi:uncharacterized damage-inducible protein DinB
MTTSIASIACGTALIACASIGLNGTAPTAEAPQRGQEQTTPAHLVEEVHRLYYVPVQRNIVSAAEQFPEDKYTWQPTPEVRSWARLIGHITDDNNMMCWAIARTGERPAFVDTPNSAESGANKASKATLVGGLRASIERCDQTFAALTPATMNDASGLRPGMTRIGALIYNTSHTNEHYGNLVTYMRLQGLVPPSSQGRGGRGQ